MKTTSDVYHIYFNQELDAVVMEWNGYATSSQFREGTELMLNTLIQHKSSKVLADIRNMVLIGLEDQQWLDTTFIPRAIKFGFRSMAILSPKSYFNQVAVESISHKIDKEKLCIDFFDRMEDARDWLKSV
jgi:ferredoxin-NADP reductase